MRGTLRFGKTEGRLARSVLAAVVLVIAVAFGSSNAAATHRVAELISVGPNSANAPDYSFFAGASEDGRYVWFTTADALVPEDADGLCPRGYDWYSGQNPPTPCIDVYERDRVAGTTRLVSTGPNGGTGHYDAKFAGATPDGTHVYIDTGDPLVAADTDDGCFDDYYEGPKGCRDIYEVVGNQTTLVSTGPGDTHGTTEPRFSAKHSITPDASRLYFLTGEPLASEDLDGGPCTELCSDAYVRSGGTPKLISRGPTDTHQFYSGFNFASEDGRIVIFGSYENLVPEDTDHCAGVPLYQDNCYDIYARDMVANTTELVSTGPRGNQDYFRSSASGGSSDARYVFFRTAEPLVDEDIEQPHATADCLDDGLGPIGCIDIYRRDLETNTTTLISIGPKKTGPGGTYTPDEADYEYSTPDGGRVFFETEEELVDADVDGQMDVYEWSNGTTTLISASSVAPNQGKAVRFMGSSRDGDHVFVSTGERLLASDLDDVGDIYRVSSGTIEQVSKGPTGGNAEIYVNQFGEEGVPSPDGRSTFFATAESLVPDDTDTEIDEYEWRDGQTKLLLDGTATPSFIKLVGQTPDAHHVFFSTSDALVSEDGGTEYDLYAATLNRPPSCDHVAASGTSLWPANRHFRGVRVSGATDPEGDPVTVEITGVTQDEPVGRRHDARTSSSPDKVWLRAERNHRGDGRVYRVAFSASDGTSACSGVTTVEVRRKGNHPAVDSAPPSFDSFGT
jgi:hypothetical protein